MKKNGYEMVPTTVGNLELSKVYQISLLQDIPKTLICKYATCGYLSHQQLLIASDNKDTLWGKNSHGPYPHGGYSLVRKVGIYDITIQMKHKIIIVVLLWRGGVHNARKHVQDEISICSRKIRER